MTNAQTQTCATKLLAQAEITLHKRFEDLLLHVFCDTWASVLHFELKDIRLCAWRWRRWRSFSDANVRA